MPYLQNMACHILNDGICYVDGGGAFGLVPKVIWQKLIPPDEFNRIPFVLNCLLIQSEGKNILVDTGYGPDISPKMQQNMSMHYPQGTLLAQLAALSLQPKDIDIVINTHLHADHCGGNTRMQGDTLVPTFPNAQYYVQRLEWAEAMAPNERTRATYWPDNYAPLQKTKQLALINGDTQITNQVRTAMARGHTRGHQVVIIESNEETALFVADMTSLHYHFQRLAWVTGYDVEPLESIETKRYWQQWVVKHNALLIFQHDTQITTGRLIPDGRNFKVTPAS